ncbi:MAG: TIGR03557 family F420-dependent LLM class oxidoreductase [Chloroflexota bacterium]
MTFKVGYAQSSEERTPEELVRYARQAEETGFTFSSISDHFHPWTDAQGQSPFVWSIIGGIAQVTQSSGLVTTVTCPIMRTHPAIIAQAAATSAAMMPGRFMLGVGSGEALNEHVLGDQWPPASTRIEMLEEAVHIIRELWKGEYFTFYGDYFTVETARIYTLPDELPPIMFAAGGKKSAELAGRIGDGLISTQPNKETIDAFNAAGGQGKPKIGQLKVCYAPTEAEAAKTALKYWPTSAIPGESNRELPLPAHFQELGELVTDEQIKKAIVCGPDPQKHIDAMNEYAKAGFDHIAVGQCGPDQESFFRFNEEKVVPKLDLSRERALAAAR